MSGWLSTSCRWMVHVFQPLSRRCLSVESGSRRCLSVELGSRRCQLVESGSRRCLSVESGSRRYLSIESGSRRCLSTTYGGVRLSLVGECYRWLWYNPYNCFQVILSLHGYIRATVDSRVWGDILGNTKLWSEQKDCRLNIWILLLVFIWSKLISL